ncbi:hypothetical protein [Haloarcula onubensis]|uniref:TRAM domain-containing protein n=1 Tax=Haloarcula onubensis TaxID=2950539 RepID=A0ABU2FT34_9EURY|nr:hypothetical protein [Halomicroarcula sp. S3CR25-11]MDS0283928.1 hypothetical protein [Halomicroarcula sp. S3CR25-11]
MRIRGLEVPEPLDTRIIEVEIDRISNSGTPIAYPTKPKFQGLFSSGDGIHLSDGEPGDVLEVLLTEIDEMRAIAEPIDRVESSEETGQRLSDEERKKRRKEIAEKSEANRKKNEQAIADAAEELPVITDDKENKSGVDRSQDDEEPFADGLRDSKNDLL